MNLVHVSNILCSVNKDPAKSLCQDLAARLYLVPILDINKVRTSKVLPTFKLHFELSNAAIYFKNIIFSDPKLKMLLSLFFLNSLFFPFFQTK